MADVDKNRQAEFESYRDKMHHQSEEGRQVVPAPSRPISVAFGIFMIIIYVGVGVLFLVNFFKWDANWAWARYMVGIILILYGIFRAYRQFTNRDYYSRK